MSHPNWTTRLDPEITRQYGVAEVHNAWFTPEGWPGKGPAVCLLIPECEMQVCVLQPDGEPLTMINRPQFNRKVKGWIRAACRTAVEYRACITFSCDTAEQAERAVRMAGKMLPNYERAALERMYRADTRATSRLS